MIKLNDNWKSENDYICPFCEKIFTKKGICSHIWVKHTEEGAKRNLEIRNNIDHSVKKGFIPWNKGLKKEDDIRIVIASDKISKLLIGHKGTPHTEETKKLLSESAYRNKLGGHTSKKRLKYTTKNGNIVILQSSYEIKVAEELDKYNIRWLRPEPIWWMDEKQINHRYYGDFFLIDYNIYLDPKNYYLQKIDKEKIKLVCEQNNVKILVLNENQLSWTIIQDLLNIANVV